MPLASLGSHVSWLLILAGCALVAVQSLWSKPVLLLLQALKADNGATDKAALIKALSGIHAFNPGGLYGDKSVDINDRQNVVSGPDNCLWIAKLSGQKFTLVSGATPVCGELVPGKTVK